jgi:hypothetical protein
MIPHHPSAREIDPNGTNVTFVTLKTPLLNKFPLTGRLLYKKLMPVDLARLYDDHAAALSY